MKVDISVEMPEPCGHTPETIEERAESACELVDSGHESRHEWNFLRSLWEELQKRKKKNRLGERGEKLLEMIAPVMHKHAEYDPRGVTLDSDLVTKASRSDSDSSRANVLGNQISKREEKK